MVDYLVTEPVVDLRKEPSESLKRYQKDPLQETQLLMGERVTLLEEKKGWARVEAVEQLKNNGDDSWQGYPGWVKQSAINPAPSDYRPNLIVQKPCAQVFAIQEQQPTCVVSMGTKLTGVIQEGMHWVVTLPDGTEASIHKNCVKANEQSSSFCRMKILALAHQFTGFPYHWGGRSGYDPSQISPLTSVDCSGLVHLVCCTVGMTLPRDAHDQYLYCEKLTSGNSLQPADLIFLKDVENPQRMDHVMLYVGNDYYIEATMKHGCVRYSTAKKEFSKPFHELTSGDQVGKYQIYFGTIVS